MTSFYLEPNSSIVIQYKDGALNLEGDLALVNNYMERNVAIARQRAEFQKTHYARIRKSNQEKDIYISALKSFGNELDKAIKADQSLSSYYKDLLIAWNAGYEKNSLLMFELNEFQENRRQNGIEKMSDKQASEVFNSFIVDPYLLKAKASYYVNLLKQNVYFKLGGLLDHYYDNDLDEKISRYDYIKSTVAANPKLIPFRDLFLALCLISNLEGVAYEDLSAEISAFAKDYP